MLIDPLVDIAGTLVDSGINTQPSIENFLADSVVIEVLLDGLGVFPQ